MQRPHPGAAARCPSASTSARESCAPPRARSRRSRRCAGAAGLLDHRDVEVALLVRLHLGLIDRAKPAALRKPSMALLRRADARAFLLLAHVGLARRHAMHGERQPARRGEGLGALVDEAGVDQPVGDDFSGRRPRAPACARGFLRKRIRAGGRAWRCRSEERGSGMTSRLPSKAAGRVTDGRAPTSRRRRRRRRRRRSRRRRRKIPTSPTTPAPRSPSAALAPATVPATAQLKSLPDQPRRCARPAGNCASDRHRRVGAAQRRGKRLRPRLFHVERHRIGQQRLEALGGDFRRLHVERGPSPLFPDRAGSRRAGP